MVFHKSALSSTVCRGGHCQMLSRSLQNRYTDLHSIPMIVRWYFEAQLAWNNVVICTGESYGKSNHHQTVWCSGWVIKRRTGRFQKWAKHGWTHLCDRCIVRKKRWMLKLFWIPSPATRLCFWAPYLSNSYPLQGKGLFIITRKEGYPSMRVNPSWRGKVSLGLQAKFQGNPTTRNNLMHDCTQNVWKQVES